MAPRKNAPKKQAKTLSVSELDSDAYALEVKANQKERRAERFKRKCEEMNKVLNALNMTDAFINGQYDASEIAATVRDAHELAMDHAATYAEKLRVRQAGAAEARKLQLAAAQAVFDHPDSVAMRKKKTPDALIVMYAVWDADSETTQDDAYARVIGTGDRPERVTDTLLRELQKYTEKFGFAGALTYTTRPDEIASAHILDISLTCPSGLVFFLRHVSKPLPHNIMHKFDNSSTLTVYRQGQKVITYDYYALDDDSPITSTVHAGMPDGSDDPDATLLYPEDLSADYSDPYARYLRFLIMGFPYRALTSGTLAKIITPNDHLCSALISPTPVTPPKTLIGSY